MSDSERRKNMQAIRSTNTKIEILLAKAMWAEGLRYRRNDKTVFGKPDFTFKRLKLAIFCDSEFWHGKDWDTLRKRLTTNSDYWIPKIQRNINRDIEVTTKLINEDWVVLRFWEKEIKKNIDGCITKILETVESLIILNPPFQKRRIHCEG